MMHCPLCGSVAHTRSSRYLSEATKERYHQCQNINCSCTFATHESVARVIVKPGDIIPAQPHPDKNKQRAVAL
ncbi:DNA-binding transcriptional regulator [Serratia proteamaculans]|uniref:DNA-binding transcriptional regulator n=1 Tax=Serratia proteamaculans TaxID=28151 RepID=A0A5Q2V4W9_SERPR|nr:DNA-binding transcriptional regulator [Serratia proteamaculans]QGH60487.1 DNA-binding transcriptional regulator [Serratia proteamaculans]